MQLDTTPAALEWNDDLTAIPNGARVWLIFGIRTRKGPWERIARRVGDGWDFDSKQVNYWFARNYFKPKGNWNEEARERVIHAWAPLRHVDEQDPANLARRAPPNRNADLFE